MTPQMILIIAICGAGGGFAWFLYGLSFGRIRNNKYIRKAAVEATGGLVVASFVTVPISPVFAAKSFIVLIAFATGIAWSGIVQILRRRITEYVEEKLKTGDKANADSDSTHRRSDKFD